VRPRSAGAAAVRAGAGDELPASLGARPRLGSRLASGLGLQVELTRLARADRTDDDRERDAAAWAPERLACLRELFACHQPMLARIGTGRRGFGPHHATVRPFRANRDGAPCRGLARINNADVHGRPGRPTRGAACGPTCRLPPDA
jgi:hypothetical protein